MSIADWFREKWGNRVRQFGLSAALAQTVRALVRPVWQMKCDLVMAIPNHQPKVYSEHSGICVMTVEAVKAGVDRGELTERQAALLQGFLADGCQGFLSEVDDSLASYAFVQPTGTYFFGGSGRLQIPEGMMILKNLLVFQDFRGHSLGKKLNQVRIASVPANQTPLVFVLSENRFAIRNLKLFGFEEMLIVTRTMWFKKWTSQRIRVLNKCDITNKLIHGLESS